MTKPQYPSEMHSTVLKEQLEYALGQSRKPKHAATTMRDRFNVIMSQENLVYWAKKFNLAYHKRNKRGKYNGKPKAFSTDTPKAKFLVFDIETAPVEARTWGLWKQNVGLNMIAEDWYILSFAAKWLHSDEVMYFDLRGQVRNHDDTPLLDKLHELLNEADVVIAHNGRKFDVRKVNARLIANGYPPPRPYRIVDTLEMAKRSFAFTSNKLEYLTHSLCTEKKLLHGKFPGFDLWRECLLDNPEAWDEMEAYNRQDVVSLEELYWKLQPYDTRPVNLGVYYGTVCCSRCGSHDIRDDGNLYSTNVAQYKLFQCGSCGGWLRGRKIMNSLDSRRAMLSAV